MTLTLHRKDINKGNLILVNAKYPLLTEYNTELIPVSEKNSNILMERSASAALSKIFIDMNCKNEIVPISGYRSSEEQKKIYADSIKEYGHEFTKKYVALPQCSEHQTGYAIDLGLNKDLIDFICPDFPYEGISQEFRKIAHRYGFIERYQSGKEDITGIAHEPWHFRFVGYPHSEIMMENVYSLEEYIENIKQFTYEGKHLKIIRGKMKIETFYIPILSRNQIEINLPEDYLYKVSGNNIDGFIITLWRQI